MASTTKLFMALQQLYKDKADADLAAVSRHVARLLTAASLPADAISREYIQLCCKNAGALKVFRCAHASSAAGVVPSWSQRSFCGCSVVFCGGAGTVRMRRSSPRSTSLQTASTWALMTA